ncbi:MAG: ACP S-malonyltransferase [Gemmatimonadetes bacterium]|nr:ACP S-malonyltransferase [Gemmatimonadota bacterium]NNF12877.1 ACP S-malonyltransferase [Gemmatimonadota bacterium]
MALALIFPGQGSQHVGMARELAEAHPAAADILSTADDVLGFSLSGLMADGPEDELTATKNAQPALLTHSVAVLRVVQDRLPPVEMAAGHSLGEFSAYVAAGTLDFEDALAAVRLRGELMHETGVTRPGAMAAVLGLDDHTVEDVCTRVEAGVCVPANFNSRGQVVISGDLAGVREAMALATEAGAKKVVELNVSGAFHSPLMEPAADGLRDHLEKLTFRDPSYPVYSNATAEPVRSGELARQLLVKQLTSPVRWAASVQRMVTHGADRFMELGPGKVLSTLNRRNAKGLSSRSVGEPADITSWESSE